MRFLFLTQYYTPEIGAPQVRLAAVVKELRKLNHEVEIVTALPNYPGGQIIPEYRGRFYVCEQQDGVRIHRVWLYAATGAGLKRIMNYGSFTITSSWGLLQAQRPDYIFVESPPLFLSIPSVIANWFWKSKIIFNVADLWPDSIRDLGLMRDGAVLQMAGALEKWSYRTADKVNAVTEGILSTLEKEKLVPKKKILFLPNGVDINLFRPATPDTALARQLGFENKKVFLYAGTLGYAQGLDIVLDAAARLKHRSDIIFVFIGDGSEKSRLREMARNYHLDNVVFLNPKPVECVAKLYSLATAGLATLKDIPLFDGARPSKVFPALASGVPVLYSGAGEGANLINQAQAGIVVPPENAPAFTDAVLRLADNPELAKKLGGNGRACVEENFSWPVLIHDWLNQLVEDNPAK